MNEELQKELLAILRELKDGTGPAWQVLVEQRGGYLLTLGFGQMAACLALVAVFAWLVRVAKRVDWDHSVEGSVGVGLGVVATGIGASVFGGFAINSLAAGAFPLGQLLGKVIG